MVRTNDGPAALHEHAGEREPRPLGEHAAEIADHLARLARIRAARMRLGLFQGAVLVLAGGVFLVTAVVLAFSAARLVVGGLSGGLQAWLGGRVWTAELASGLALLALLAGLFAGLVALGERRILRRLGRKSDARS